MNRVPVTIVLSLCLALGLCAAPMLAADLATVNVGSSGIHWQPTADAASWVLTVTGPDGFYHQEEFTSAPSMDLFTAEGQFLPDGVYKYELTAIPQIGPQLRQELDAAAANLEVRERLAARVEGLGGTQSGSFRIHQGALVTSDQVELPSSPAAPTVSTGDLAVSQPVPEGSLDETTFNDNVIVIGSLCVGFDCVSSESFGFDTIRLKENNLRIHFDDTSSSSSFPRNDWRLTANDSANGGLSRFTIEDATANRNVFTIEAAARSNSLYVDSSGRVGIGTSNPLVEAHVADGDSPALRLEQNGSSGFTPQTWDIAGNESNFFVRDLTNGSRLPFRIRPGAPTSSIDIASDGDVGIGTSSPSEALHIQRSSGAANVLVEAGAGNASLDFDGAASTDLILDRGNSSSNGRLQLQTAGGLNWSIGMLPNGTPNLHIGPNASTDYIIVNQANGQVTIENDLLVNGTCTGCDAVFQPDFELESIEEHATLMWERSYLPAVGPTPEGEGLINVFEKTTGILQELEKAHIYIEQLHDGLKTKNIRLSALEAQNEEFRNELAGLREAIKELSQD